MQKKYFIDTNILVHTLFPSVDVKKHEACVVLLSKAEAGIIKLWTTEWVIAELVWVLERQKIKRAEIKKIIKTTLTTKGVEIHNHRFILNALSVWEDSFGFIDAINMYISQQEEITQGYSYDRDLDQFPHFSRREP